MKKQFLFVALLMLGLALNLASCSKDEENNGTSAGSDDFDTEEIVTPIASLDYADFQASWCNYMKVVANLLYSDSHLLYTSWSQGYNGGASFAETFKNHNGEGYTSAEQCASTIIEKMAEIANEVGEAKIGEPFDTWRAGDHVAAVLAVESWYSWHSRDDYTNNIRSIQNAYYGKYFSENETPTPQPGSLYRLIEAEDAPLNTTVVNAINAAINAIQAIHNPFRNYINTAETKSAIDACATLQKVLNNQLRPKAMELDEDVLSTMVNNFVDNVVLPTYADLDAKNLRLKQLVDAFAAAPSDQGFEKLANAWMSSRRPWETSEAFLFGPVDDLQLDPNMDSWPLDQEGIENCMRSGNYEDLIWNDNDDDEAVETAQALRGFHTLEYLIFKDGKPRKTAK